MTERLEREGQTAPYYHAVSRPRSWSARPRIGRSAMPSSSTCRSSIVHVSGREAMEQIRWAQPRGLKVYAETCPQYITLTADDLKGLGHGHDVGEIRLLAAAPRRGQPGGDLGGLRSGVFQTFSSDHCPFRYDDP